MFTKLTRSRPRVTLLVATVAALMGLAATTAAPAEAINNYRLADGTIVDFNFVCTNSYRGIYSSVAFDTYASRPVQIRYQFGMRQEYVNQYGQKVWGPWSWTSVSAWYQFSAGSGRWNETQVNTGMLRQQFQAYVQFRTSATRESQWFQADTYERQIFTDGQWWNRYAGSVCTTVF